MDDINICTTNVVASTSNNHQEFQDFTPPSQHHHQIQEFHSLPYHKKPLKKRCKWIKDMNNNDQYNGIVMSTGTSGGSVVKPKTKYTKKPDPNAPKITPPCSVCGRKFWSWKALFGHMRCHPERQWRGINPPSNFRPDPNLATSSSGSNNDNKKMSMKDHEAAGWLLMLANSPPAVASSYSQPIITSICDIVIDRVDDGRFECSSCKKVFGSHQALGGHRASHRNVKGCFANAKNDDEENARIELPNDTLDHQVRDAAAAAADGEEEKVFGHQCSICLKVFSSGQALGGHKRCHWEKGDDDDEAPIIHVPEKEGWCLDLNLPAPLDDGSSCSTYSTSGLTILDLRLGT